MQLVEEFRDQGVAIFSYLIVFLCFRLSSMVWIVDSLSVVVLLRPSEKNR